MRIAHRLALLSFTASLSLVPLAGHAAEDKAAFRLAGPAVEGTAFPAYMIPNIPNAAEVYFADDNYHMVGQTNDPKAVPSAHGGVGNLTWILSDDGAEMWPVTDVGQDACSHWFPGVERIVFTSTRDNMDMPVGNWSDPNNYPEGGEIYTANVDGTDIKRLTFNKDYDAEVAVSPDGKYITFGREVDGRNDIWVMNADGSDQRKVTDTEDWQEGHPIFFPDSNRIMFRAWKKSDMGKIVPTPMTVFSVNMDGTDLRQHTFNQGLNWATFPAPDGRHFVYVRAEDNNWDVWLGDLAGGEPMRLTFTPEFDGLPNISPNGKKLSFARATKPGFMQGIRTFIMDLSSLGIGPENYVPFDSAWGRPVTGNPDDLIVGG